MSINSFFINNSGSLLFISGSYNISSSISTSISSDPDETSATQSHTLTSFPAPNTKAAIQLDPNDPGSFMISGSNSSASLYMSSSGRLGFGTTNPESEFDIRTDDFKIRKRSKASGIRMNEDGNFESFNNDTNSAATGSEIILKYTRGAALSIPSGKRKEDLRDEEFFGKVKPQTNDVLGSIRWVADSGSLDQRKGGEAGNIKMQVASADVEGVTGKLSINIAADPGAESQQLYLINGATQKHEFSGSVSIAALNLGNTNVTSTAAELNILDGVTSTAAELNILDGVTSTAAELNILDGVTSTAAELNKLDGFTGDKDDLIYAKDLKATGVTATEFDYLDGVTSAIQTQLNAKTGITTAQATLLTALAKGITNSTGHQVKLSLNAAGALVISINRSTYTISADR